MKAVKSDDAAEAWKFALCIVCALTGLAAFLVLLHR